ncbi:MAG TPA: hypothetical protein VFL89_05080 [Solirubrobacterales bacterium]|nr:hypothetical protein [Solirubrobacterales bacterium]
MTGAAILVTWVGEAVGSRAAAAALACAGAEPDRAALLIDLAPVRAPRPALVATAAARRLEERLAIHRPRAGLASRGQICHLALPADRDGVEQVAGSLALARESVCAIHLPPDLLQPLLGERGFEASGALLRADLESDRALTALATRDLIDRGLRVMVLKRPLAWLPSRRALFGVLPEGSPGGLPPRLLGRLLEGTPGDGLREALDAAG